MRSRKGSPFRKAPGPAGTITSDRRLSGLNLLELLLVVSFLAILMAMTIRVNDGEMRASETKALRDEIAAWLAEVAIAPEDLNQPCTVTFTPGSKIWPGDTVATVQPPDCAKTSTLKAPGNKRTAPFQVGLTQTSWVFTERGAVSASNSLGASSTNTDIIIRFSVGGQPPLRCIRLSGIMGLVRFGVNATSGDAMANTACSSWKRT